MLLKEDWGAFWSGSTLFAGPASYFEQTSGEKKNQLLTLKAQITTAADGIHKYFFIVFQRK